MMSFQERAKQEARLSMLVALKRQTTGRLPVRMFEDVLELDGHNYSLDRIRTELRALEELGVVKLIPVVDNGDFSIAQITDLGVRFLARKVVVDGIKRPEFDVEL